jgi:AhpD family alkylhydroperoxidase
MRVEAKPLGRYPWYLRPLFWNQRRRYGTVLEPALLWARSPKLFATVALLYGALDRASSPIAPALRSLLTVRVSQVNRCRFCVDINAATLIRRGVPLEKIAMLDRWRQSELFDACERAVLEYAECMTDPRRHVSDDAVTRLRDYFDDDGIVELTALIAFQNMASKFNAALDVAPQGFCRIPDPQIDDEQAKETPRA